MKEQLEKQIIDATITLFNEKGLKFTMDDIAGSLAISKKTIYTVFKDKESLCMAMVDTCFDAVKEKEQWVMKQDLPTIEKLRRVMAALPEAYMEVDFRLLYELKDKYPKIYSKVAQRLESGWELTIALIEQGMAEGVIRSISIPVFKTMMEATLEQFFQRDILIQSGLSYQKALDEVVMIMIHGIEEGK